MFGILPNNIQLFYDTFQEGVIISFTISKTQTLKISENRYLGV